MRYAVEPAPTTSLAVAGREERFPVHRVFCVGRNYAAHAREMGQDEREPPFFFMKPADAVVDASRARTIPYPPMTSDFQHEIELVVALGQGGREIPADQALAHVYGYAVGLDMTRRDLQLVAREQRRPWDLGKDFEESAILSEIVPAAGEVPERRAAESPRGVGAPRWVAQQGRVAQPHRPDVGGQARARRLGQVGVQP